MKIKTISILIILAVLVSSITACKTKDSYLIQVMKLAPEDTTRLSCSDTELMANDSDFRFLYEDVIRSELVWGLELQDVGIDVSKIDALGYITELDLTLVLIGDFNFKDIRDALTNEDFIEDEYQGVEIWINDDDEVVAFVSDMIVSGYTDGVEACIRVYKNMDAPLYDNEDMKSVIDKLPIAPLYVLLKWGYMDNHMPGSMCGGTCINNEYPDDEILNISGWLKFPSEASAEDYMEDITDIMGYTFGLPIVKAEISGQFIEVTGEIPAGW